MEPPTRARPQPASKSAFSAVRPTADTIAAIATPAGRGGVGIVRVSGSGVDALARALLDQPPSPRVATVATFRDANGGPLDTGIALYFPAPRSYTGEAVLELHGHGGPAVMRLLLSRCVELGARLAEPGEFTKRAFLNGKLDLAQAESVADMIEAATATAVRAAARSLVGEFSREVHAIVAALTELRMYTEATLDFPDEDVTFLREGEVAGRTAAIASRVEQLLSRARSGALLREGLTVVLIGRPNVGKSSLLNRFVGEDAAIVTAIAGTTRDTIERGIELAGIPLTIIDTAGLRESTDEVERIGIERTWSAVERADLAMLIVDARADARALESADRDVLARIPAEVTRLVVHNKIDLAGLEPHVVRREVGGTLERHVWISALTASGLDGLTAELRAALGNQVPIEDTFLARARHIVALRDARAHLDAARKHLVTSPPPIELFAEELREAQLALSAITGEFTADDLLGQIFSRFCIGK